MRFCFFTVFISLTFLFQSCKNEEQIAFCDFNAPNSALYIKDSLNNTGYYTHLEPAIDCSNETGKPILIVFTCWVCSGMSGLEWKIINRSYAQQ